ncbi:MAG: gephyrin-like molybdotransferase Glp [Pseudomonadota bacterium]
MTIAQQTTGLILAGGQASRMGGIDKGLLPLRGLPLAAHAMQRLAPQVARVLLSANRNLTRYAALGAPVLPDQLGGFAGPLAGLEIGLRHCDSAYLVCVPCDSPFLPADLVARLGQALCAQRADLAVAVTLEVDAQGQAYRQRHPVFCLLKTSLLAQLSAYLAQGGRRMDGWYGSGAVAEVLFDDGAAFRNINTAQQLQRFDAPDGYASLAEVIEATPGYDAESLTVAQAQHIIGQCITPLQASEKLALRSALDRVLAADIVSPISVPSHDNSAMDGYALRGADVRTDGVTSLHVVGTVLAGPAAGLPVGPGQCARIMTGAVMPDGCDSVVPQESVNRADEHTIVFDAGTIAPGANRRLIGEDLMRGGVALKKGKLLRPADLGLLASLGMAEVAVRRRARVAYFSTGDELCAVGEPLATGCVYDSNRYTLYGMLSRLGCDLLDMGSVRDDPASLEAALREAGANANMILTSGGVSAGAADYTRPIMAALGEVAFWRVEMRPGRPLAFGKIASPGGGAYLFGLPGNPVAVMVSFYFFVRPALLRLMGADPALASPPLMRVPAQVPIRKKRGRTEYQRGILSRDAQGRQQVRLTGAQGSGILRSMADANCMLVLPDTQGDVAAGDLVEVLLFEGLV